MWPGQYRETAWKKSIESESDAIWNWTVEIVEHLEIFLINKPFLHSEQITDSS